MKSNLARALLAVLLVYAAFNATIGELMRRDLVRVESQLGASPSTFEVRSGDLCTQLAGNGWRRTLQSMLFPWPTLTANALQARWNFSAEPSADGVTCGKHALRHVLHATPRS